MFKKIKILFFSMKRKVALIGPSTLMVSLPRIWVKKHQLAKGQEVTVEEKEGSLLVHAPDQQIMRNATLHFTSGFLDRSIRSLYRQGYHEIIITCDDSIDFDELNTALEQYLGLEVIEHTMKRCVLRNVADSLDQEFDVLFRKVFLMNQVMGEDIFDALFSDHPEKIKAIEKMERTNNKLVNLCFRILNKSNKMGDGTKIRYAIVLSCMENIADHYRDLCVLLRKNTSSGNINSIKSFFSQLLHQYSVISTLHFKFDETSLLQARDTRKKLIADSQELLMKTDTYQASILHYLASVLNQLKDVELNIELG